MTRNLTAKQNKFLSVLFDEADGDVVKAKLLAGYSENTSTTEIIRGLKEEVIEAMQKSFRPTEYFEPLQGRQKAKYTKKIAAKVRRA